MLSLLFPMVTRFICIHTINPSRLVYYKRYSSNAYICYNKNEHIIIVSWSRVDYNIFLSSNRPSEKDPFLLDTSNMMKLSLLAYLEILWYRSRPACGQVFYVVVFKVRLYQNTQILLNKRVVCSVELTDIYTWIGSIHTILSPSLMLAYWCIAYIML